MSKNPSKSLSWSLSNAVVSHVGQVASNQVSNCCISRQRKDQVLLQSKSLGTHQLGARVGCKHPLEEGDIFLSYQPLLNDVLESGSRHTVVEGDAMIVNVVSGGNTDTRWCSAILTSGLPTSTSWRLPNASPTTFYYPPSLHLTLDTFSQLAHTDVSISLVW